MYTYSRRCLAGSAQKWMLQARCLFNKNMRNKKYKNTRSWVHHKLHIQKMQKREQHVIHDGIWKQHFCTSTFVQALLVQRIRQHRRTLYSSEASSDEVDVSYSRRTDDFNYSYAYWITACGINSYYTRGTLSATDGRNTFWLEQATPTLFFRKSGGYRIYEQMFRKAKEPIKK